MAQNKMEEELKGLAILNEYDIVVNKVGYINASDVPSDMTLEQLILSEYGQNHTYMEFSTGTSITNNQPEIGYKYNKSLNAFIPPKQNDTYILNSETFQWEPDPNLEYDLYEDGKKYKWNGVCWTMVIN